MPHSLPTGRVYGMHLSPYLPPIPSATKWWRWYRTLEASDLFDVFVGQLCSSLKCDKCQNISLTFDPFWELSVSLPKVRSPDSYVTYMYIYVLFVHFCFTFLSLPSSPQGHSSTHSSDHYGTSYSRSYSGHASDLRLQDCLDTFTEEETLTGEERPVSE